IRGEELVQLPLRGRGVAGLEVRRRAFLRRRRSILGDAVAPPAGPAAADGGGPSRLRLLRPARGRGGGRRGQAELFQRGIGPAALLLVAVERGLLEVRIAVREIHQDRDALLHVVRVLLFARVVVELVLALDQRRRGQ